MLDLKEVEKIDELKAYKGKWKNLIFLRCGRSFLGDNIFNSEKEALAAVILDQRRAGRPGIKFLWCPLSGPPYYESDISHTIQVPVGDS